MMAISTSYAKTGTGYPHRLDRAEIEDMIKMVDEIGSAMTAFMEDIRRAVDDARS